MIRALFFDLDDTLVRYDAAYELALTESHRVLAARHPQISRNALRKEIYLAYENRFGYGLAGFADLGILPVREMRQLLTRDALVALAVEPHSAFIDELIAVHEAVEAKEIQPFSDTRATLSHLGRIVPMGIITNGPSAMQRAKLESTGLVSHFQVIVVDTEFGHPKPDTRIFAHAAKTMGLRADELLFVGNSAEADVMGAMSAGWTCVWLNATAELLPDNVPEPHHTINSLSQLLTLEPVVELLNNRQ